MEEGCIQRREGRQGEAIVILYGTVLLMMLIILYKEILFNSDPPQAV